MKVIFLDIDGVLNSTDYMNSMYFSRRHKAKSDEEYKELIKECRDLYGHIFDPRCVMWLEGIIAATGASIVISSTWRLNGISSLRRMWNERDLPGKIIGITPNNSSIRGEEIDQFLMENDYITEYVIIDDDSDMLLKQDLNFVKTNNRIGLTLQDAQKAILILTN